MIQRGVFDFDNKRDIMDIKDLAEKLRTLDTEKLKEIDEYCAREIKGYGSENNELREDNKIEIIGNKSHNDIQTGGFRQYNNIQIDGFRQHDKKCNPILWISAAIGVAILVILLVRFNHQYMRKASVYASNIYPYTQAGGYNSYEELPTLYKHEIETNEAFAILSFIRNSGEKVSSVEQQYCEILSLEPIEEAVIRLDAVIRDNVLYLFAFNNGWGNTDAPVVKSTTLNSKNTDTDIGEFSKSIDYAENAEIKAAGVVLLAKYVLNIELLEHYYEKHDVWRLELHIRAEGKNYDVDFQAYFDLVEDGFNLRYPGIGGGEEYWISHFAVLDVDQNPSSIRFKGKDATPLVEDILRVETVLAPMKSCIVKCRNIFSVNGKRQQTDVFTAKVTVPVFNNNAIYRSGSLTQELAQLQQLDEMSIDRVIQKYYYQPESIWDYAGK